MKTSSVSAETPLDAPNSRLAQVGPSRELLLSTPFLLKRLGFAVKERSYAAFESLGLLPQHHAVLSLLDEGARETQGTIADALGYDRSMLVGLLDELDPAHAARHHVRLGRPHRICPARRHPGRPALPARLTP